MPTHEERRRRLRDRVDYWARKLRVRPRVVRVQRMTRKWGSCSTAGIVTLAVDLADQEPAFRDFVIAHELLHLRVPNHGKLFKALMSLHVPGWRKYYLGSGLGHSRDGSSILNLEHRESRKDQVLYRSRERSR